jgi:hypothetical protein
MDDTDANVAFIAKIFSLDTPQLCDNITILMRNTGVVPGAMFSMDIYTYNENYEPHTDEGQTPQGELIAQSTNYFDNSEFKISNDHTNGYDYESWNLTTFKFDSVNLNASQNYIFDVRYTGMQQSYYWGTSPYGMDATSIAVCTLSDYGLLQYWEHYENIQGGYVSPFWYAMDYSRGIPWIMNQQRVVSSEDVTFTFEPFSHGRVFYKVSGGDAFPPTGAGVDVSSSGESVNLGVGGYVFLYAVADDGYFFSGMNVTGIGDNLRSGYCVSKEESRTIQVSFDVLPEGVPNGYTLVIASDKGCGVNYFVDDDIGYIEPSFWEDTTNYVRLSNVPFKSIVYTYAVAEENYFFSNWYISANNYLAYAPESSYQDSFTNSNNPYILACEGDGIGFDENGSILYYTVYVSISLNADWIGAGTPPPEPTTGTDSTPTPTPTLNPSVQRTFAILDLLFGDNGILGAGFGLLVIIVCLLPCIVFSQFRNLYGFLGFFNVGVIITIATELIPIWILIVLVLLDIAVILRNRLSGGSGYE